MKKTGIVMAVAMTLLMLGATTTVGAYHITGTWKDPVANVAKGNIGVMANEWPGTGADACDPPGANPNPDPFADDHDEDTATGTGLICNDNWWAGNTINIQLATLRDLLDPVLAHAPPPLPNNCDALLTAPVCNTPVTGPDGVTLRGINAMLCADNSGPVPNDVCDEVIVPAQIVQGVVVCEREAGLLGPAFAGNLNGVGILPAAAGWGGRCFSAEENTDLTKKKPLDYDQWVEMEVRVDPAAAVTCGSGPGGSIGYFGRLGSNAHGLEVQRFNNFFYRQMVAALVDDGHVTYFINGDEIGANAVNCYGYDTHEKCPAPGGVCDEPTKSEVLDSGELDLDLSLGCNRLTGHESFEPESYDYGSNARGYDNPNTTANQSNDQSGIIDQNTVCTGPSKDFFTIEEPGAGNGAIVLTVDLNSDHGTWDLDNTGAVGLKVTFWDEVDCSTGTGSTLTPVTTVGAGTSNEDNAIPAGAACVELTTTAAGNAEGTFVLRGP